MGGVTWWIARHAAKDVRQRKRRLEALLEKLDAR
jgi:hypothetical protein